MWLFYDRCYCPNRTNLRLKNSSHNNLSETKIMIFHCECCHRLHIFLSSNNAKIFVYWHDKVFLSKRDKNPIPSEQYGSYITDDYDGAYPIIFTNENRQILLNFHDKIAVFRLESVSENHHLIYHENHSKKILYDKSTVDMSLSANQIRCPCGWLINLQLIDEESIIYLYDLVNWVSRVKYEFRELRNFQHLIGLYCKKCKRIMLPAKEQKYVTFFVDIGVPLYACGGCTIPLLQQWLYSGMSIGSAACLTGPSTKITNLGALKIVLGIKNFVLYLAFVMIFSLICGFVVNLIF